MKKFTLVLALALSGVVMVAAPQGASAQQPAPSVCDPTFGGKYSGVVRELDIPEDAAQYGTCHDYGPWADTAYKGHTGLPSGAFWTYSAPIWYVWTIRNTAPPGSFLSSGSP